METTIAPPADREPIGAAEPDDGDRQEQLAEELREAIRRKVEPADRAG